MRLFKEYKDIGIALIFSIILHIFILWTPSPSAPNLSENAQRKRIIEVSLVKPEAEKSKQIVQMKGIKPTKEAPKNARFLSKNNVVVEKETRARNSGKFNNKFTTAAVNVAIIRNLVFPNAVSTAPFGPNKLFKK